jgi:hypothetical protein
VRGVATVVAILFGCAMVVLVVLDSWAWQARKPGVSWVFRRDRMFHSTFYTSEGNRRRRFAVAWFAITFALGVAMWVSFLVAFG